MSDPPTILPDDQKEHQATYDARNRKLIKITGKTTDQDRKAEQERRSGVAMYHILGRGISDLHDVGLCPPDKMTKCTGAHAPNSLCVECGWGACGGGYSGIGCGNSTTGSFGWAWLCKKCKPAAAVVPQPAVVPTVQVIVPPAAVPTLPKPRAQRKVASKKARGRNKRTKRLGGLGGFGGAGSDDATDSDDGGKPSTPPDDLDDSSGLWGPIPAPAPPPPPDDLTGGSGGLGPIPAPAQPDDPTGGSGGLGPIPPPSGQQQPAPDPNAPAPPSIDLTNDIGDEVAVEPTEFEIVELERESPEFKKVEARFRRQNLLGHDVFHQLESTPKGNDASYIRGSIKKEPDAFQVLGISKVHNPDLQILYTAHLKVVTKNVASQGGITDPIEETVYHGTTNDKAGVIAKSGFNRSHGIFHVFGHGAYYDIYGPLAQNHATSGTPDGIGCVIVARLATGRVGETKPDDRDPPPGCDCGANGENRMAGMRVSFRDNQSLPTHIIKIQRKP